MRQGRDSCTPRTAQIDLSNGSLNPTTVSLCKIGVRVTGPMTGGLPRHVTEMDGGRMAVHLVMSVMVIGPAPAVVPVVLKAGLIAEVLQVTSAMTADPDLGTVIVAPSIVTNGPVAPKGAALKDMVRTDAAQIIEVANTLDALVIGITTAKAREVNIAKVPTIDGRTSITADLVSVVPVDTTSNKVVEIIGDLASAISDLVMTEIMIVADSKATVAPRTMSWMAATLDAEVPDVANLLIETIIAVRTATGLDIVAVVVQIMTVGTIEDRADTSSPDISSHIAAPVGTSDLTTIIASGDITNLSVTALGLLADREDMNSRIVAGMTKVGEWNTIIPHLHTADMESTRNIAITNEAAPTIAARMLITPPGNTAQRGMVRVALADLAPAAPEWVVPV